MKNAMLITTLLCKIKEMKQKETVKYLILEEI